MIVDLEDRRERCADEVPEYDEMLMKEFLMTESERTGLGVTSIYKRIKAGYYPDLKCRRVSPRQIYVSVIKTPHNSITEAGRPSW